MMMMEMMMMMILMNDTTMMLALFQKKAHENFDHKLLTVQSHTIETFRSPWLTYSNDDFDIATASVKGALCKKNIT